MRVGAFQMLILSVLLYGSVFVASNWLADKLSADWIVGAMMLFYVLSVAFFVFFYKGKDRTPLFLPDRVSSRKCLYFLPMISVIAVNLLFTEQGVLKAGDFMLMLAVAVGEELFFRLCPFVVFGERRPLLCVLLPSALFSAMHLVNLISTDDVYFVMLQTATAFAVGLCFSLSVLITKRVGACILLHVLINITGMGERLYGFYAAGIVSAMICFLYAARLFCVALPQPKNKTTTYKERNKT